MITVKTTQCSGFSSSGELDVLSLFVGDGGGRLDLPAGAERDDFIFLRNQLVPIRRSVHCSYPFPYMYWSS